MIVISERFGKLGNRLLRYARTLALAELLDCSVLDLSFYEYAYCFRPEEPHERSAFRFLPRLLGRRRFDVITGALATSGSFVRLSDYVRASGRDHHEGIPITPLAHHVKFNVVSHLLCDQFGYYLKPDSLLGLLPRLRRIFRIAPEFQDKATQLVEGLSDPTGVLIGVHIRTGDYRTFGDGIFYFENSAYAAAMRDTLAHPLFRGRNVRFLIVSDEPVPVERDFAGLPVHYFGQQQMATDMALLSACQYLIATNSTFSGWVSYLGQIPRYVLTRANPAPDWERIVPADATVFV